ncbi:MAG TPA: alpha/beta hydrolase, partial [Terriglobales bacterium]|nr:alpha/beta hydrolase [Terriglobales bacterium]
AELWVAMMAELGYDRFYAQGGDFGASVSTILGWRHARHLLGVHLNYIPSSYQPLLAPGEKLTEEETAARRASAEWGEAHGAYAHVQRSEPQTLSYALDDSPVGLAAWLLQRFRDWSDCGGDLTSRFPLDDLLAQVTLYWLTGTIGSSMRLYGETARQPLHLAAGERVSAPCAVARFPLEEPFPPRRWVERGYHLVRWTEMPRGGHFAALEEPELLADDVRAFAASRRAG